MAEGHFLGAGIRWARLAMALLGGPVLAAQGACSFDIGPLPSRNMFSFLQAPMVYEPVSPFLVGQGHWRFSLQEVEASNFSLPKAFLALAGPGWGLGNRSVMTESFFKYMISFPTVDSQDPFMPFTYEEITRSEFQVRTGVGPATDLWLQVNVESHAGGILDDVAESFHATSGFHQFGRPELARNQCVVAIGGNGQVLFYSGGNLPARFQDPMVGVVHQVSRGADSGLDLMVSCKPPMTKAYDEWKAGFDVQGGAGGWWKSGDSTFLYGAAYIHRGRGNAPYQALHYTSNAGAHLGWQGYNESKVQPFFQLYYLTGCARMGAGFNRGSLQHDLGFHWFVTPRAALSFRYINNITENGNTDDFQFAMDLTARF